MSDNRPIRKLLLTIAYNGTAYGGFARQTNRNTIQAVLDHALERLLGHPVLTEGASRTDAGVHAEANHATLETPATIPADRLAPALNSLLPPDIHAVAARQVPADFHPSRNALAKLYRYRLYLAQFAPPAVASNVWCSPWPLDLPIMQAAAAELVGYHDFTSFAAAGDRRIDRRRHVGLIRIAPFQSPADPLAGPVRADELHIDVLGNGFVYNMVRNIVGTLLDFGRKRIEPQRMRDILHARDRRLAGQCAAAQGLCLMRIWYPHDPLPPVVAATAGLPLQTPPAQSK